VTTGSSRWNSSAGSRGERLGSEADVVPGGHLVALSRPAELTDQLIRYL
jgi:hypothetical protein